MRRGRPASRRRRHSVRQRIHGGPRETCPLPPSPAPPAPAASRPVVGGTGNRKEKGRRPRHACSFSHKCAALPEPQRAALFSCRPATSASRSRNISVILRRARYFPRRPSPPFSSAFASFLHETHPPFVLPRVSPAHRPATRYTNAAVEDSRNRSTSRRERPLCLIFHSSCRPPFSPVFRCCREAREARPCRIEESR